MFSTVCSMKQDTEIWETKNWHTRHVIHLYNIRGQLRRLFYWYTVLTHQHLHHLPTDVYNWLHGCRQWVWAHVKKYFTSPSKDGWAKSLYAKPEKLSGAAWCGLHTKGLICTIDKWWSNQQNQKYMQHGWVPGLLPDCCVPVICTGFPPPPPPPIILALADLTKLKHLFLSHIWTCFHTSPQNSNSITG